MIDLEAGWDINLHPAVIGCLWVRRWPSVSAKRSSADCSPLPLRIHCGYLTPCLALNALRGNAYLHFTGPNLHMKSIIWVFQVPIGKWGWSNSLVAASSRCFLAIYSEMGSTEECCLFRRPACLCVPAATLADWQVVKMSLCTNQKVGTQGRQSFALKLLWSHSGIRASKRDTTAAETHAGSRDKNRAWPSIYINIPTNYTSFKYCESTHLFSNLDLHIIKHSCTLSL